MTYLRYDVNTQIVFFIVSSIIKISHVLKYHRSTESGKSDDIVL